MHRHRAGDPTALQSAQLLAGSIDNPALEELVQAGSTRPDFAVPKRFRSAEYPAIR
jgi:hypothetical protein